VSRCDASPRQNSDLVGRSYIRTLAWSPGARPTRPSGAQNARAGDLARAEQPDQTRQPGGRRRIVVRWSDRRGGRDRVGLASIVAASPLTEGATAALPGVSRPAPRVQALGGAGVPGEEGAGSRLATTEPQGCRRGRSRSHDSRRECRLTLACNGWDALGVVAVRLVWRTLAFRESERRNPSDIRRRRASEFA
jgi:hypothetical protein